MVVDQHVDAPKRAVDRVDQTNGRVIIRKVHADGAAFGPDHLDLLGDGHQVITIAAANGHARAFCSARVCQGTADTLRGTRHQDRLPSQAIVRRGSRGDAGFGQRLSHASKLHF
jgi:hypothetical protein